MHTVSSGSFFGPGRRPIWALLLSSSGHYLRRLLSSSCTIPRPGAFIFFGKMKWFYIRSLRLIEMCCVRSSVRFFSLMVGLSHDAFFLLLRHFAQLGRLLCFYDKIYNKMPRRTPRDGLHRKTPIPLIFNTHTLLPSSHDLSSFSVVRFFISFNHMKND